MQKINIASLISMVDGQQSRCTNEAKLVTGVLINLPGCKIRGVATKEAAPKSHRSIRVNFGMNDGGNAVENNVFLCTDSGCDQWECCLYESSYCRTFRGNNKYLVRYVPLQGPLVRPIHGYTLANEASLFS